MANAVVGVQRAFALNCPHEHCSQTSFLNLATHVGVKSSHLWRRRNRKENCADSLSGECARVCRQHHNAPPGRQPAAHGARSPAMHTARYACGPLCFICILVHGARPHTHSSTLPYSAGDDAYTHTCTLSTYKRVIKEAIA